MFFLGKCVDLLLHPLAWVGLLLLAGLWVRPPRTGRRLVGVALALLLALGWEPLPDALLRNLESHHAEWAANADLRAFHGIVVLGGALEPGYLAMAHTQPLLNDAAERMTATLALARRYPHLRILFTGGDGDLLGQGPSEAQRARHFFADQGLDLQRLQFEDSSRTTWENAKLGARVVGPDVQKRWLLVTSAWHMPRAMSSFAQAGWNVHAYPVDFRTAPVTPWTTYSLNQALRKWYLALHEYVGLWVYPLLALMQPPLRAP